MADPRQVLDQIRSMSDEQLRRFYLSVLLETADTALNPQRQKDVDWEEEVGVWEEALETVARELRRRGIEPGTIKL